jgi:predicted DNA-binding protein YlxM (UPF0122 family)
MGTAKKPTTRRPADGERPIPSIAVIGDIVGSKQMPRPERGHVQRQLEELLSRINKRYAKAIGARFLVTLGDEFQGVLKQSDIIPDLIWDIEGGLAKADVRIGIGYGTINPPLKKVALGMDGPAFHAARAAIEEARKRKTRGGRFLGFGQAEDLLLNSLAALLRRQRATLTENQLVALGFLRQGYSQSRIAETLGITKQAVNSRAKSVGWEAYLQGEEALRAVLKRFDTSAAWPKRSA